LTPAFNVTHGRDRYASSHPNAKLINVAVLPSENPSNASVVQAFYIHPDAWCGWRGTKLDAKCSEDFGGTDFPWLFFQKCTGVGVVYLLYSPPVFFTLKFFWKMVGEK